MKRRIMMTIGILSAFVAVVALTAVVFLNRPQFGRLPQGERLERIKRSPNYRDGQFCNQEATPMFTGKQNGWQLMVRFLTDRPQALTPDEPLPVAKQDLKRLPTDTDLMVWFGHSSYLLQLSGVRFLIDPVFYSAAPVSFINKAFAGTAVYTPADLPERIDYLVISHDHWDHLDYQTAKELRQRVSKVICPLGVGEHFAHWGYDEAQLVELDWQESATLQNGFGVHCLPARHFSGRGLRRNQTLWASFMLETPGRTVYIGGDSGYGAHFKAIGKRFPHIDLAILENGQYNDDWRYIHTMPQELGAAASDLGAQQVITVHHSKYALARHAWDEPLKNEREAARQYRLNLTVLSLGTVTPLPPATGTNHPADNARPVGLQITKEEQTNS